jgi:hypothetical protein
VPLVAAAVCPHPPIIVPELAGAAAHELDSLREACDAALTRLVDSGARRLVVVGADTETRQYHLPIRGSFAPWGVPVEVVLGGSDGAVVEPGGLPLSLTVAAWLASRRPETRSLSWRLWGVAEGADVAACVRLADVVGAEDDAPWALLAMGDGSACRGEKSPGYDDPRAQPYDDAVAAALATADRAALLALQPELSARLRVAGRAAWQVLAAAAGDGATWHGDLSYYAAPYGVSYFVATWTAAAASGASR